MMEDAKVAKIAAGVEHLSRAFRDLGLSEPTAIGVDYETMMRLRLNASVCRFDTETNTMLVEIGGVSFVLAQP